ncbi:MAG: ribokinase [Proteobacteria bacterium]|nr:ribokinase [Pseudomonadota bacterium]
MPKPLLKPHPEDSMILNFGSINIDYVYRLQTLPQAGETLSCQGFARYLGGKGINQSIAIARAGGTVKHIGAVGADGAFALAQIADMGLDTNDIRVTDTNTGHAVICLDKQGENHIIIHAGANAELTENQINSALDTNPKAEWVVIQNETNLTEYIAKSAKERGLSLAYSAAPFDAVACQTILPYLDILAVNETEATALSHAMKTPITDLKIPTLLITKGAKGAELWQNGACISVRGLPVKAIDTVGAGDTFFGSFIARLQNDTPAQEALNYAASAAALQCTQKGAATAIPSQQTVLNLMKERPL